VLDEPRLVLLPVVDLRELGRRAELAPPDGAIAVQDQRCVGMTFLDQPPLHCAIALDADTDVGGLGVERQAPASTPHAVVTLDERCEGRPAVGIERSDRPRAHRGFTQHRQNGWPAGSA
jgi:hypothetical protein